MRFFAPPIYDTILYFGSVYYSRDYSRLQAIQFNEVFEVIVYIDEVMRLLVILYCYALLRLFCY
jgi:hypothetical protein